MAKLIARGRESVDREQATVALEATSAIWDSEPDRILLMSIGEVKEEMADIGLDPNKPAPPAIVPPLPNRVPGRRFATPCVAVARSRDRNGAAPQSIYRTWGGGRLAAIYRALLIVLAETIVFAIVNAPILHDFAFISFRHNALNWVLSLMATGFVGLATVVTIIYHCQSADWAVRSRGPWKTNLSHAGLTAGILMSLTSAAIWLFNAEGAREVVFATSISAVGVAGILSVGWLASSVRTSQRQMVSATQAALRRAADFGKRSVPAITNGVEGTMEATGRFFTAGAMRILGQTGVGALARAATGCCLVVAVGLMVLHRFYVAPGRREPIAHVEILVDRSFSEREGECLTATERSIITADPLNLATVTVLATGDKATANEPIEVAHYQITDAHRILDARRTAELQRTKALADVAARCEELPKSEESAILVGVKRAVEHLQRADLGNSSIGYLHVLTRGDDNVDPDIARALSDPGGDWRRMLPPRIDNKGIQTVFWGIPGLNQASGS
ncbi:MAG TPA: hypothetical protein VN345_16860, partial [Blastocatellia bacterium]|nr:hypothetical protein [Blastocatellia bacterium]